MSPFELTSREQGIGVVIEVEGELDLTVAERLQAAIEKVSCEAVVIDLTGCDFLDSTGIAVIIRTRNRFAEEGRRLVICCPRRQVLRVLEVTGLADADLMVEGPDTVLGPG